MIGMILDSDQVQVPVGPDGQLEDVRQRGRIGAHGDPKLEMSATIGRHKELLRPPSDDRGRRLPVVSAPEASSIDGVRSPRRSDRCHSVVAPTTKEVVPIE